MAEEDFYIVLPSNSCPLIHPDNHASKYIVTFQDIINLKFTDGWKVAVTEVDYNFIFRTLDTSHGIKYRAKGHFELPVNFDIHFDYDLGEQGLKIDFPKDFAPKSLYGSYDTYESLQYTFEEKLVDYGKGSVSNARYLIFYNKKQRFKLTLGNPDVSGFTGANHSVYNSHYDDHWGHMVKFERGFVFTIKSFLVRATVTFITEHFDLSKQITVPETQRFTDNDKLLNYIEQLTKGTLFEELRYNDKGFLTLVPRNEIAELEFLHGLNKVLGFTKTKIKVESGSLTATSLPRLNRGIKNMLVYASVAAPIQVGNVRAPLLKHILLPAEIEKNELTGHRNLTLQNPMYVPVSQTTVGHIEINIRSDSGEFIPFIEGSITTLVLHFKKFAK